MTQKNRKFKNFFIYPRFLAKSTLFYRFVMVNGLLLALEGLQRSTDEGSGLLIILAVVVFAGFLSVWYLHRVTGPMRAIRRTCELIQSGQTSERIHFRPGDEFTDVANSINDAFDALAKK